MTTILHKRGTGIPPADQLKAGELAIDTLGGKLYTKQSDGTVVEIGGADGDIVASLNDLTDVDLTTPPSDGDQLTFDGVRQRWIATQYKVFPSEMPDSVPSEQGWTGETEEIEATGSLGFKVNGFDYEHGPATISQNNALELYWLGDPESGEDIDSPDGTYISGGIRAKNAEAVVSYHTRVDKNPDVDFQDVQDVEPNQVITSEVVTVSGTNSYCYFSGSSDSSTFEYKKNSEGWTAVPTRAAVYFELGDDIQLRHTSGDEGATVTSTVTLGEKTITWVTTTIVSGVITPTIEAPENDSTGISQQPVLMASEYQTQGSTPEHASSDWQVMDENGDVIYESLNNTSDLETHKVAQKLATDTPYQCRVRYRASDGRESEWSPIVSFRTTDLVPGQMTWKWNNKTSWTVPAGCYSITIISVGHGGNGYMGSGQSSNPPYSGGGGALQWLNDYPVQPGEVISLYTDTGMTLPNGDRFGGGGHANNEVPGSPDGLLDGGQTGGDGKRNEVCAGGGGAAGYKGRGGNGRGKVNTTYYSGTKGTGGGGGGGGSSGYSTSTPTVGGGGYGGYTYLFGEGASGAAGVATQNPPWPNGTQVGGHGSYNRSNQGGGIGGNASGGGGYAAPMYDSNQRPHGTGSKGVYRWVWPGDESRGHFPNLVEDV
jgi:hypothetical protein